LKTFDNRREGKGSTRFAPRNRKNPNSIGFSERRAHRRPGRAVFKVLMQFAIHIPAICDNKLKIRSLQARTNKIALIGFTPDSKPRELSWA
jgi:hypothetical protein